MRQATTASIASSTLHGSLPYLLLLRQACSDYCLNHPLCTLPHLLAQVAGSSLAHNLLQSSPTMCTSYTQMVSRKQCPPLHICPHCHPCRLPLTRNACANYTASQQPISCSARSAPACWHAATSRHSQAVQCPPLHAGRAAQAVGCGRPLGAQAGLQRPHLCLCCQSPLLQCTHSCIPLQQSSFPLEQASVALTKRLQGFKDWLTQRSPHAVAAGRSGSRTPDYAASYATQQDAVYMHITEQAGSMKRSSEILPAQHEQTGNTASLLQAHLQATQVQVSLTAAAGTHLLGPFK